MEALVKRKIESGTQYNKLFPKATGNDTTIKRNANVEDTVAFIPKVVAQTKWQTKELAKLLQGNSKYETCSNIWHFVYHHIAYQKDEDGYEQIRSPARAWQDRFHGVDCDCYSVFISSILSNLKIKHQLRITKYGKDYYQHIYPIVPLENGNHITIDCVVNQFNYEEPYTAKKDYNMNLQFLDGIDDDITIIPQEINEETNSLFGNENDLGKLFGKRINLKNVVKKGLHAVNRINPGTTLVRNGVLASLKLNLFKVAQRLKWAYLTPEQANQKGILPDKFQQLVRVKEKLEKIYFGAGGKPENFRHAILKGKGNKNKEVGIFGINEVENLAYLNTDSSLQELLGTELFHAENEDGFGELGEPATATAIASASAIMGSIAAILGSIGNIFKPNSNHDGTKDFDESDLAKSENVSNSEITTATNEAIKTNDDNNKEMNTTDSSGNNGSNNFWTKNKKWLKPVSIVAGGVTLLTIGYLALKPAKKTNQKSKSNSLNGIRKRKKKKHQHNQQRAIALM